MLASRRDLLAAGSMALAGCTVDKVPPMQWRQGEVRHILPAASTDSFFIRVSVARPLKEASLAVDGRRIAGRAMDGERRFWTFATNGLVSDQVFTLQLFERENSLCDAWPLRTFPDDNALPDHVRIAVYTCAGGYAQMRIRSDEEAFRPLSLRQRLIERALSFRPHALVANGDHIYWDQRAWRENPNEEFAAAARAMMDPFGAFDRSFGFAGGPNEEVLKRIGDPQIADLYGCRLRSTPVFFVCDDHDYFENDEATARMVTFPPEPFLVGAQQAIGRLYYPPFLPHASRPTTLPGTDPETGLSHSFGTLRFGRLFEGMLADCGRFLSLDGARAGLIPPAAESWILSRLASGDIAQTAFMPSHPMGWSAGKWREWYPDIAVSGDPGTETRIGTVGTGRTGGRLTTADAKYMWQPGWNAQHQRLLVALAGQRDRPAFTISGDLHAIGHGRIIKSGDLDLSANPVHAVLAGPISTSTSAWPSTARGISAVPAASIEMDQPYNPLEKNGFTLLDITADAIRVRQFGWREPTPESEIDTMAPLADFEVRR